MDSVRAGEATAKVTAPRAAEMETAPARREEDSAMATAPRAVVTEQGTTEARNASSR